jgi:hypothetical protein
MFFPRRPKNCGAAGEPEVAMLLGVLDSRFPLDEQLVYGVWFVGVAIFLGLLVGSLILAWAIKSRRP